MLRRGAGGRCWLGQRGKEVGMGEGWWRQDIRMLSMRRGRRMEREMGRSKLGRGEKGRGMVRLARALGSNRHIMILGLVFSGVERHER